MIETKTQCGMEHFDGNAFEVWSSGTAVSEHETGNCSEIEFSSPRKRNWICSEFSISIIAVGSLHATYANVYSPVHVACELLRLLAHRVRPHAIQTAVASRHSLRALKCHIIFLYFVHISFGCIQTTFVLFWVWCKRRRCSRSDSRRHMLAIIHVVVVAVKYSVGSAISSRHQKPIRGPSSFSSILVYSCATSTCDERIHQQIGRSLSLAPHTRAVVALAIHPHTSNFHSENK